MYYPEPTRSKRLDILLHLTQYGNEMLLVTGPEGCGKSTLMHHFLKKAPANWKICQLDANDKMDPEQLLYRLCHSFNLPVEPGAPNVMTTQVKRQLDQLLARTQTVAIVIDDAHRLADSVLVLLTELAKVKNQHSGAILRIVLFAEPQIKIQLASIELETKPKYPIRKIDLPPFNEQQTGELIRHRTRTAGLQADSTFTDAAISKIYKQSEGIPGDIVDLAHRVLFEMTPLKRRTKSKHVADQTPSGKARSPLRLIAASVAVVAIALLLVFQKDINGLYSHNIVHSDLQTDPEHTITALALPELAEEALDTINSEATAIQDSHQDTPSHNATNFQNKPGGAKEASQTAVFADAVQHPQKSNTQNTSTPPSLAHNIRQEPWLLDQNPNHYTVQLVAGYQKTTVNNYLNRHKLPATDLAYYHSLNKGKDWHSLVYGAYPDYASAKSAVDALPSGVRKAKPWIRRFRGIQKEINDAADSRPNG
jgi:type II secretory pathway predicted ATPase ExeA/septal ring-binding cell division protein DamX